MIDAPIIVTCFSAKDIRLTRSKEKQEEEKKPKVCLVHDYNLVPTIVFHLEIYYLACE
jgi:hypothetical protein